MDVQKTFRLKVMALYVNEYLLLMASYSDDGVTLCSIFFIFEKLMAHVGQTLPRIQVNVRQQATFN